MKIITKKIKKCKFCRILIKNPKFCSISCRNHYYSGKKNSIFGTKFTKEHKQKISYALKGKIKSLEHRKKLALGHLGKSLSIEHRRKIGKNYKGQKNHLWKGGVTSQYDKIRHSFEAKLWKEQVKKRDNYICQNCGSKNNLHCHHIKAFIKFPKLRFAILNGVTLCEKCHKLQHYYKN